MFTNYHINNFKILRKIGSGAYGLVFQVEDIFTGYHYAIKIILKNNLFNNFDLPKGIKKVEFLQQQLFYLFAKNNNSLTLPSVDLQSIIDMKPEEIELLPHYNELHLHLKVMDHSNIVTIHQVLESQLATIIVMDYYSRDLFTSIVDHLHFANDPLLIKKVVYQLCCVLHYCNEKNIYHCDLKPENILLDDNDNIMLCDFGLATMQDFLLPNICIGSSYYMAPERIAHFIDTPNKKVNNVYPTMMGDIWSLGILIINLTCTRNPWSKASVLDDRAFAHYNKNSSVLLKILPISDDLYQLLDQILKINPLERISYTSICDQFLNLQSFTKEGPLSNFGEDTASTINSGFVDAVPYASSTSSSNVTSPYYKESETSSLLEQQSNYSLSSNGEDDIGYEENTKLFLRNNQENWDWKETLCFDESTTTTTTF